MTSDTQSKVTEKKSRVAREYIESLLCALDKIDNGSVSEQHYIEEKIGSLARWNHRFHLDLFLADQEARAKVTA